MKARIPKIPLRYISAKFDIFPDNRRYRRLEARGFNAHLVFKAEEKLKLEMLPSNKARRAFKLSTHDYYRLNDRIAIVHTP